MTAVSARDLPRLLLLTDRSQLPPRRRLTEVVAEAVDAGCRGVVVRERDLEDRERAELVFDLQHLLEPVDGTLLVGCPRLGLPHGEHLRRSDPVPRARPPLLGRSCHDAGEVALAAREGCDYLTLSPVAGSASKPAHGPLLGRVGVERLTRVARAAARERSRPPAVYALGGVSVDNAADWVDAGAHGLAVMGAVMRAEKPATATADLLAAVHAHQPRLKEHA